jgi:aspartyl protease family protein
MLIPVAVLADMQAVGLMQGMAILEVEGQRVVIRNGQTKQGVTLISSDSKEAVVKYKGKQVALQLGLSVTSQYAEPVVESVRLYRADNGHYFTRAKINGKTIDTLVDTGATTVAMSSDVAAQLGIKYASGRKGTSSTAGGIVTSYSLRSNHIQVGSIKKYSVPITVIEGSFPEITLLGMSFLNRVGMSEESGVLTLSDK